MGRQKEAKDERAEKYTPCRLHAEDADDLVTNATTRGLSVAEYYRQRYAEGEKKQRIADAEKYIRENKPK